MKRTIIIIGALIYSTLLFLTCSNLGVGNGSDVGNAKLTGRLVDGRTNAPAYGALVRIYPVYANKMAQALGNAASGVPARDSTLSDSNGEYQFDNLDQGIYSLDAIFVDEADTLTMRHPSVVFMESKDLGYDTLQLPGIIKGKVAVPRGESARNIICFIPGTSYLAMTNDTGGFRITGIPAGIYSLATSSMKFNDTTIPGIRVASNRESDIGTITLNLNRGKNEHNVWGVFNSTTDTGAIARIEARVSGDNIPAENPQVFPLDWRRSLNGYSGFIYLPEGGEVWTVDIWVFDSLGHRVGSYRVPAINRATGDVMVPAFNAFNSVPVITQIDTIVSINDSIRLNPSISLVNDDSVMSMKWQIGGTGQGTAAQRKDTVIAAPRDSGTVHCIFTVVDRFGNVASDTAVISVVTDAPVVSLESDSMANTGTSLTFTAAVEQRFGSVVMYIWSLEDDTTWNDSGSLPVKSITFNAPGEKNVICKARDDDGNQGVDTMKIYVVTEIGGVMPLNSVLRESLSPYRVKRNLFAENLRIEPGTEVRVDSGVRIETQGTFEAQGTSFKKIVFKPSQAKWGNSWGPLVWESSYMVNLKFCELRGGSISTSPFNIESTIFDSCTFNATSFDIAGNYGSIRGCEFNSSRVSINCENGAWLVSGNNFVSGDIHQPSDLIVINPFQAMTISSNHFSGGGGISISGYGAIINNTIENCRGNGISSWNYCGGNGGLSWDYFGISTILNNSISNCLGTGIFLQSCNSDHLAQICRHNIVVGNGFGTPPSELPFTNAGIIALGFSCIIDSNIVTKNTIGIISNLGEGVTNNNIYDNRDYNFSTPVNDMSDVNAPGNWWGTTDTSLIQQKIYDLTDDLRIGRVFIDPIATDSIPGAGPR